MSSLTGISTCTGQSVRRVHDVLSSKNALMLKRETRSLHSLLHHIRTQCMESESGACVHIHTRAPGHVFPIFKWCHHRFTPCMIL